METLPGSRALRAYGRELLCSCLVSLFWDRARSSALVHSWWTNGQGNTKPRAEDVFYDYLHMVLLSPAELRIQRDTLLVFRSIGFKVPYKLVSTAGMAKLCLVVCRFPFLFESREQTDEGPGFCLSAYRYPNDVERALNREQLALGLLRLLLSEIEDARKQQCLLLSYRAAVARLACSNPRHSFIGVLSALLHSGQPLTARAIGELPTRKISPSTDLLPRLLCRLPAAPPRAPSEQEKAARARIKARIAKRKPTALVRMRRFPSRHKVTSLGMVIQ